VLFWLLRTCALSRALVFTKSAASTARLVRALELLAAALPSDSSPPISVAAYSSDLAPGARRAVLAAFRAGRVGVLACSDLVARGLDAPGVQAALSYDAPVDMRKYVHRAGRTARAGAAGQSWVLVEQQEARHFKQMLRDADHLERVRRVRVPEKELAEWAPAYAVRMTSSATVRAPGRLTGCTGYAHKAQRAVRAAGLTNVGRRCSRRRRRANGCALRPSRKREDVPLGTLLRTTMWSAIAQAGTDLAWEGQNCMFRASRYGNLSRMYAFSVGRAWPRRVSGFECSGGMLSDG
jgi:superfamily II DNA/RNA helicase